MSYVINKNTSKYDIVYMEYDLDGYSFVPKKDNKQSYIQVNLVTIYNTEMIESLLTRKFIKKFNKLTSIIMNLLYQDDESADEGDFFIVLDEIERLKSVVENKYKKFLQNEEYKEYIHKLTFLDNQVRQKIAVIEYYNKLNYEVSKGRGM